MKQNTESVSPKSNESRNTYVVEHLTEALLKLLHEKDLEDISIRELCDRAGVSRVSFYRNFERKEDILRMRLDQLFAEWSAEAQDHGGAPLSEQIRVMIAHFERYREFYAILDRQGLGHLLKDALMAVCGPKPEHEAAQAYASAFAACTLYGWIDVWFQRGMRESADEIAELFRAQGL